MYCIVYTTESRRESKHTASHSSGVLGNRSTPRRSASSTNSVVPFHFHTCVHLAIHFCVRTHTRRAESLCSLRVCPDFFVPGCWVCRPRFKTCNPYCTCTDRTTGHDIYDIKYTHCCTSMYYSCTSTYFGIVCLCRSPCCWLCYYVLPCCARRRVKSQRLPGTITC